MYKKNITENICFWHIVETLRIFCNVTDVKQIGVNVDFLYLIVLFDNMYKPYPAKSILMYIISRCS
jgi:hypothetical protein